MSAASDAFDASVARMVARLKPTDSERELSDELIAAREHSRTVAREGRMSIKAPLGYGFQYSTDHGKTWSPGWEPGLTDWSEDWLVKVRVR